MTCLLTRHFKYLLRLQQCQIKDESTIKQECKKKKKIKLLLKKNINAVATLITEKGGGGEIPTCFTVTGKQEGNHASLLGVPWLPRHPCAHASLRSAQGQVGVNVTTAVSVQSGKLHVSSQQRPPGTWELLYLWKSTVLVLSGVPGHRALNNAFRNSRPCSAQSVAFALTTIGLKLSLFFFFFF